MKKLLHFLGMFLFLSMTYSFSFIQNTSKIYFENKEIIIEAQELSCEKPSDDIQNQYIVLKISNKTDQTLEVSFKKELWYNNVCSSCNDNNEFSTNVVLQPKSFLSADCNSKNKDLKIFKSNPHAKKVLSKFELKEIQVTIKN